MEAHGGVFEHLLWSANILAERKILSDIGSRRGAQGSRRRGCGMRQHAETLVVNRLANRRSVADPPTPVTRCKRRSTCPRSRPSGSTAGLRAVGSKAESDVHPKPDRVAPVLEADRDDELTEHGGGSNPSEALVQKRGEPPGRLVHVKRHPDTGGEVVRQRVEDAGMDREGYDVRRRWMVGTSSR